jgi:DNA polymerase delta subunit 1
MELFIVKWEIIDELDNNITILGFSCFGDCIRIIGYHPHIYANGNPDEEYIFLRGSNVAPDTKKITLKNSEEIRNYEKNNFNVEKYEQDIPVLLKFLSSHQINNVGWVKIKDYHKVNKKERMTRFNEYMIKEKSIENLNHIRHDIPNIKVLSFDIECYSHNRGMSDARNEEDVIFMISMVFFNNEDDGSESSYVLSLRGSKDSNNPREYNYEYCEYDSEFELLGNFFKKITEHDPSVITGYNIFGFDMKYIKDKYYSYLRNIPGGGRCKEKSLRDEIIERNWRSSAYGLVDITIINFTGRCCVDIYQYLKMEIPLQKYSLDFVSQKFLKDKKIDMDYETMFRTYEKGRLSEIADYCYVDSLLTKKLWRYLKIWYSVVESSKIFFVDIHDLYSRGQQKKIFSQIYYYGHTKGYIFNKIPKLQENFCYSGATVLEPHRGLHNDCCIVDFASLYPSIIISENICYTTQDQVTKKFLKEKKGLIPSILEFLIKKRKIVKEILKNETDEVLRSVYDKRQFAYKVATNSFYGAFGSRDSEYLQLLEGAELVTMTGREYLQKAIGIINSHRIKSRVIYGDTDSCFFVGENKSLSTNEINEIISSINSQFPDPVHVSLEGVFDKIFFLAKKKYICTTSYGLKYKGVITAKRDSCLWARNVYQEIITMIMSNKDNKEVNLYLRMRVLEMLQGDVHMDSLYINRNLGNNYKLQNYPLRVFSKVLSVGENRDVHPGERLEYYFIRSNHRYQGYRMASKDMIKKYNLEVDYKYYILHQLKLPVVQLYDALNWKFY